MILFKMIGVFAVTRAAQVVQRTSRAAVFSCAAALAMVSSSAIAQVNCRALQAQIASA